MRADVREFDKGHDVQKECVESCAESKVSFVAEVDGCDAVIVLLTIQRGMLARLSKAAAE